MKKKINIRTGLLITLFVLIIVTMLALWLIQTVFMDDFYQNTRRGDVTRLSKEITSTLTDDWRNQIDDKSFQSKLSELCKENEASYCFMLNSTPYGASYVQDDILLTLIREHALDEYVREANENMSTTLYPVVKEEGGQPYALVLVKGIKSDTDTLTLVISTDLIPTSSLTRTVTIQLITLTAILLVIAVLLAIIIAKKLTRPIAKLSKLSKRLADGVDKSDFPTPTGIREIDDLVDSIEVASIELSRTEKLQRDLVTNISHDLKTPLTLIRGYAEMMRDLPSENTAENLNVIIKETDRLSALVSDVLDLSKLQSGVVVFEDTTYDITKSIRSIVESYRALCKDYTFDLNLPDRECMVNCDEGKITQAISNLINNALKYTGADKTIFIKLKVEDSSVTFMIKDTGDGIPKDKIEDVWQRHYKIDGSEKHDRYEVGSGIGLSIVKGIVEHYTADFGVKNVKDGCIFYFTLKLA